VTTRRERVVLELEDNFTAGRARAAATRRSQARDRRSQRCRVALEAAAASRRSRRTSTACRSRPSRAASEIDKYSGRLRLLADVALVLGPAASWPALVWRDGVSAGVAGLALYGLGDALTALNKYQLDPTAANLKTLNQEMAKAGPAGREFVLFLDSLGPKLTDLQMVARAGFLPGLQQGIESLMTRFPEVRRSWPTWRPSSATSRPRAASGWLAPASSSSRASWPTRVRRVPPWPSSGALAGALIGHRKAMAPVGAVTLPILTKLLDVIAQDREQPARDALCWALRRILGLHAGRLRWRPPRRRSSPPRTPCADEHGRPRGAIAGVAIAIPVLSSVYDKLYSIGQTNGDIEKLVGNAGKLKDFGGDIERTTSGGVGGFLDRTTLIGS
jgi:hypothetical protein